MFDFYQVGGHIRDELLGLQSKDIDYVAVETDKAKLESFQINALFDSLVQDLTIQGFEIFLKTPDCYTIRARFPKDHENAGITADFVLARKEIGYKEGTREPIVVPGTLYDDLQRRDFTVNAMAKDPKTGAIIDPFGGIGDLKNKVLRTPISGQITFADDPLRILRGIRLAITKGFSLSEEIVNIIKMFDYNTKFYVVSEERIREELYKCFHYNTKLTLFYLNIFWRLSDYIFSKTKLWLKPTNEQ